MSKLLEDYGKKVAKEAAEKAAKKERTKNIIALLKQGVSSQTIHEALKVPLEVIQELECSLKISK